MSVLNLNKLTNFNTNVISLADDRFLMSADTVDITRMFTMAALPDYNAGVNISSMDIGDSFTAPCDGYILSQVRLSREGGSLYNPYFQYTVTPPPSSAASDSVTVELEYCHYLTEISSFFIPLCKGSIFAIKDFKNTYTKKTIYFYPLMD